jgi:hypothetical protein
MKFSLILIATMLLISTRVIADENMTSSAATLRLSPNQCIAISQGKTCYVDVELMWQTRVKSGYCLYSSQSEQALLCWKKQNKGQYKNEISSSQNVQFLLKDHQNNTLATTELKIAWIYKKNARSRSNWRMF